jgi:hypothetical protein
MTALASQKRSEFLRVQGESERLRQTRLRFGQLRTDAAAVKQPGASATDKARYVQQASDLLDSFLRAEVR